GETIEVILEEGFSEDDKALAADLAAFQDAHAENEVINAQVHGIDTEKDGEEEEEEPELPVVEGYEMGR
ncbi:uncharacterized protein H6S33_006578, partial [Morchella sextelata]|uniref:uncharacterized protein n=1 Tax=Morchella sextelata TaxID=1174677 RepID=UPI001D059F1F